MFELIAICSATIAAGCGLAAMICNRRWPEKSQAEIARVILRYGMVGAILLMVAGCVYLGSQPCAPDDTVCDAPAMAQAGVIGLGSIILVGLVLIGTPAIYLTLKFVRWK